MSDTNKQFVEAVTRWRNGEVMPRYPVLRCSVHNIHLINGNHGSVFCPECVEDGITADELKQKLHKAISEYFVQNYEGCTSTGFMNVINKVIK